MSPQIVTYTTDFGTRDTYVAQMKGVLLRMVNVDNLRIVDLTHEIPPQNVIRAAFAIDEIADAFPPDAVHVVVVDPGVGTERSIVALDTEVGRFVGPDNGLFGPLVDRVRPRLIIRCADPTWWRTDVSHTFHGRDVMTPLAAHWVNGVDPRRFGTVVETVQPLGVPLRPTHVDGEIRGRVLWADHFGNLVTNVHEADLRSFRSPTVRLGEDSVGDVQTTYGDERPGSLTALVGSSGRLELAINLGSAAERLGWSQGDARELVVVEGRP